MSVGSDHLTGHDNVAVDSISTVTHTLRIRHLPPKPVDPARVGDCH
jgi:hypothetical protein